MYSNHFRSSWFPRFLEKNSDLRFPYFSILILVSEIKKCFSRDIPDSITTSSRRDRYWFQFIVMIALSFLFLLWFYFFMKVNLVNILCCKLWKVVWERGNGTTINPRRAENLAWRAVRNGDARMCGRRSRLVENKMVFRWQRNRRDGHVQIPAQRRRRQSKEVYLRN